MSWPAVRTEPVRLREAGLSPFWNGAWMAALGAPFALSILGGGALALFALFEDGWQIGLSDIAEMPSGIVGSTLFFAVAALLFSLPVWAVAIALAALAARTGWAGWLVALSVGGILGICWATLIDAWDEQSLEWQSTHALFGILGLAYAGVFWLAIRWTAPDLLRGRQLTSAL